MSIGVVTLAAGGRGPSGDNPGSCLPLVIGTNSGSTVGLTDDSNETCPYSGSTSPDAYYCFTPATTTDLSLDLCESAYDTQLYVYDSNLALVPLPDTSGGACNDDACSSTGGGGFRSFLSCVRFTGGAPYYVVVDGWQGDAGAYTLVADVANPADCLPPGDCIVECPPDATFNENEPCNFGDTAPMDLINGGCNCGDPAGCLQDVGCGAVICGQGYFDGTFRDTDWYAIDITGLGQVGLTLGGVAEFRVALGRVENGAGALDCTMITAFASLNLFEACEPLALTTGMEEGTALWVFIAADFSQLIDCNVTDPGLLGPDYVFTVDCNIACPLDLDDSGDVGFGDLLMILSNWGPCP